MSEGRRAVPSREHRARRSRLLRQRGMSAEQIAAVWEADYEGINPRVAFRWANDLTHQEIAERWNLLDPGGPAVSNSLIHDFEVWPTKGQRPSVQDLITLAQIYGTTARRLLNDNEYAVYDKKSRTEIDQKSLPAVPVRRSSESAFWSLPDVTEALANCDFASLLEQIRRSRGWTQDELAAEAGYSQSWISKVLHGQIALTVDQIRRLSERFGVPTHLLRFDGSNNRPSTPVVNYRPVPIDGRPDSKERLSFDRDRREDDDEVMRRRAFLADVTALAGLGMTGSTTIAEPIRHELNSALLEDRADADADEWNEIALEYGETYWTTTPAQLFDSLTVDIIGLRGALRRCGNSDLQLELRRVGALLAAFTAQTMANLGSLRESRRWWRTARQGADESGDRHAILWVRGREITRALYERRTSTVIMHLIEEAEQYTEAGPKLAALEFLSGKAQALAALGHASDSEAALMKVQRYSEALPASSSNDGNIQFLWGEQKQYFTESYVYSHLANFAKADNARRAALPLYPPHDLRQPAQLELHQALCLVRSRDVAEGMRHAQAVITGLPDEHRIQAIMDLGHGVLAATPEDDLNRPEVNDYREFLATSSSTPGKGLDSTYRNRGSAHA